MTLNIREKEVKLKPNSKWKIVQRKVFSILSFVNFLSKKNHRRNNIHHNERVNETLQFIEPNETKKV